MRHLILPLLLTTVGCQALEFDPAAEADPVPVLGGEGAFGPGDASSSGATGDIGNGVGGVDGGGDLPSGRIPGQTGAILETEYLCSPMVRIQDQHVRRLPELGSTASATWALALLRAGRLPPREALVTEEFLAHLTPAPEVEAPAVALHVVGTPDEGKAVAIDYSGRLLMPAGREGGLRLIVVADVSPSMRDALPILERVLEDLPGAMREGDELALVTFAEEAEATLPLTPAGDLQGALEGVELSVRTGSGLESALSLAAGLAGDAPAHVLLITDGRPVEAGDESLATSRALVTNAGHELSVALVGKPERGVADPLVYHRAFADALLSARGRAFFFADAADVDATISPLGLDRGFTVVAASTPLSFWMTKEFTVFADAFYGTEDPVALEDAPPSLLAPGFSYPVWLTGQVCNGGIYAAGAKELVSMGLELVLDGETLGASALAPDQWTATNLLAPTAADALPLLDRALFATLVGLRSRDLARIDAATDAVSAARLANGCSGNEKPACDSLGKLSEILVRARPLVAAGAPE